MTSTNFNTSQNVAIVPKIKKFLLNPKGALENLRLMEIEMSVYKEIFIEEPYFWLYDKITKPNTIVFDVGSCCGESAIYFARNPNVKKVIGYEAERNLYEISEKNVKNSRYSNKIKIMNKKLMDFKEVNLITKSNIAIKCDIEGNEKELFDTFFLSGVLADTNLIQIEFHTTEICDHIVKVLKPFFKVRVKYTNVDIGYIYAWR